MDSLTETQNNTGQEPISGSCCNFMLPLSVKKQIEDIAWQKRISVAAYLRSIIYKELNIGSDKSS